MSNLKFCSLKNVLFSPSNFLFSYSSVSLIFSGFNFDPKNYFLNISIRESEIERGERKSPKNNKERGNCWLDPFLATKHDVFNVNMFHLMKKVL